MWTEDTVVVVRVDTGGGLAAVLRLSRSAALAMAAKLTEHAEKLQPEISGADLGIAEAA